MRTAIVAIITRTKDRPVFLRRAMQSVLAQKFADWIHVIVNDGGDPAPVDLLVRTHADAYAGRIAVVHHARSQGMQNASNAGLDAADSRYVVIHDDDDSWYPDFLSKTVGLLEQEGPESLVQGVVTQTTWIIEELCVTGELVELSRKSYYPFAFVNLAELRQRNLFPPIAFLYRRHAQELAGRFRQEFDVLGDHDFNLRFVRHFEIAVIPTCHAYYHWRHGSMGNTVTRDRETHRQMLNRMKNAYHRELLDNPATGVGDLDAIEFPPPQTLVEPEPFRLRAEEPPPPDAMPAFLEDFDFDVLSLDVFDTALLRRCHRPRDVFRLMEERAIAEHGLPPLPYALARELAEAAARERLRPEVTLEEIHRELARLCGLDAAQSAALRGLELAIERELLYADPRWLELYARCRAAGKRVVFVSDMYLPGPLVASLLEECGFAAPEVYVSCDLQASKHAGELQPEVARRLGVDPARILHVGDNYYSDLLRTRKAGWQAFHWTPQFLYTPWFAQVAPHYHRADDRLSTRIMGEVRHRGLLQPWTGDQLLEKLGFELAGPLYLSYMLWVVRQARRDGLRKLVLVGRDGFHWEKALSLMAAHAPLGVEFAYLHASRKVFNFASFDGLDDQAMDFLLTANPRLRVRDFVDRTGLHADEHLETIRAAGFDDPDLVLTTDGGGGYLGKDVPQRLRQLFELLRPYLEPLFERDRQGVLRSLADAGYDPADCALVDIGWNASSTRTLARLLNPGPPQRILGYYFATWKEADPEDQPFTVKSFLMHLGRPDDHGMLLRESVNWIESLHAAPFPTLMAFHMEDGRAVPEFSREANTGFAPEQQERIWAGAEALLRAVLRGGVPPLGEYPGHNYIILALRRLLREPSPAEVALWGPVEHSEGFGLEIHKRLVEPVAPEVNGTPLLKAYRASNWRRGFLATLTPAQRAFVIEQAKAAAPRSRDQLEEDLIWKTRLADDLWAEKERLVAQLGLLQEERAFLRARLAALGQERGAPAAQPEAGGAATESTGLPG